MATTSLWPIKTTINNTIKYVENKSKTKKDISTDALSNLSNTIDYTQNKDKTDEQYYVTGINCDSNNAYQEMMMVKNAYNKTDGILGFHGYQSFKEDEVTPELAHKIGVQFAKEMWGDDFQVIVTTHLNTNHFHNHFVVNSVSLKDGHKYNYSNSEMARLRQTNDLICEENNLSHLEEKKTPRKHIDFNYYRNHDNYYTRTQTDIDLAIKNAYTYNDFLKIMKDNNYEVVDRYGKLSVRNKNYNRRIRIERQFGSDYTINNINNRIVEEVPDKLSQDDLKEYNHYKNQYYKSRSIISLFLYYIFKIKTYQKSPKNYPISNEMKKEIDKMELYNLEIRFMDEYHLENKEDLFAFHEINKELLNDLIDARKKTYEEKFKTKDENKKEECTNKVAFLTEEISELQKRVKTCKTIETHHEKMQKEISQIDKQKENTLYR